MVQALRRSKARVLSDYNDSSQDIPEIPLCIAMELSARAFRVHTFVVLLCASRPSSYDHGVAYRCGVGKSCSYTTEELDHY